MMRDWMLSAAVAYAIIAVALTSFAIGLLITGC